MRTKESLWGFFASDPQLSFNEKGEARLFAWIGQEQFERNPDGSFTQGETKFYPFKMFRRSAEHAYEKFARGDNFHYNWFPLECVRQVDRLRAMVRKDLRKIEASTLVIHAREDDLTSLNSAYYVIQNINGIKGQT